MELFHALRESLAMYDKSILDIEPAFREPRAGDIPHSLASIDKAISILGYNPKFDISSGLQKAARWYFENLV